MDIVQVCDRCSKQTVNPILIAGDPICDTCDQYLKKAREDYEQWRYKPKQGISPEQASYMEMCCRTSSQETDY